MLELALAWRLNFAHLLGTAALKVQLPISQDLNVAKKTCLFLCVAASFSIQLFQAKT